VCQICLDLLHKPFTLSPCGRISCYSCLVKWFTFTVDQGLGESEGVFRKKTCPQCRALVRERPVEAWNVKDMVATLVKSSLVRDFLPLAEVNYNEATSSVFVHSEAASHDPWASIFPPVPSRLGLLPLEGSPSVLGMFDADDQVYRCLDCMHEIWGGSCSQCGRNYGAHNVEAPDDDASGEELHGAWSTLPAMEHIMGFPRSISVNGSEDGSYEASFIDDGEDSEDDIGGAVEISSDGNNSAIEITAGTTRQGRDGAGECGDEDEDEKVVVDDIDKARSVRRRPAIGTRRQVLSDSEE
jgi:Zinc finger, C3HC4 type (RING finger)